MINSRSRLATIMRRLLPTRDTIRMACPKRARVRRPRCTPRSVHQGDRKHDHDRLKSELLRTLVAASSAKTVGFGVPSSAPKWRALRESNPCFRRERAASWTARRRARGQARRHIRSFRRASKRKAVAGPDRLRAERADGRAGRHAADASSIRQRTGRPLPLPGIRHRLPRLGGGSASPFCSSSIDCLSGERTNAITPSRGGRLMVTPAFIRRSQVA